MSIPKVIHYCWFGGNEPSPLAKICIDSWKKYCPEYKIICWDESNFDVNMMQFTKEAYDQKSWAFISDVVRLYALYNYGGVYMDADFELLKNLDSILEQNSAFTGYQGRSIPSAIIGARKGNIWIKELLDYYSNRKFIIEDNKNDIETNSRIISKISYKEFGFVYGDEKIKSGNVHIYPHEFFAPISKKVIPESTPVSQRKFYYECDRNNTYGIHHFAGSWVQPTLIVKIRRNIVTAIKKIFGYKIYRLIKDKYITYKHKN